ncbi:PTS transporter subunit EIIC [Spiroplasma endosymbiont of Aspidapion aeneum]|uniref:PTS transporter subunit EIIC n=1 Tax=Spiroplasma endosymbiont of Aspidapion aeneum TaxID=3066276 RepID=UPI00313CA947
MSKNNNQINHIPDINIWCETLVKSLGGKDNVISVAHCLTRLRFVLKDNTLLQIAEIDKLELVKGTFKASGQFQVIIGPEVPKIYEKFVAITGISSSTKSEAKQQANDQHGNLFLRGMNFLGEIFIPIIPVLVAGGIILGFRNILEADYNGYVITKHSQFCNGLDAFLWIPAQVCFWWLPVHICWSIFKKMDGDEVLGIVIGLCLLVPPLISTFDSLGSNNGIWIWDIVGNLQSKGTEAAFDFGFMKYPWKIQYTAQVIPAFAIGIIGVYINRWIKDKSPAYLSQILVPLVTIIPTYILAMFIIGPIGYVIASAIGYAVSWSFTNSVAKYFFAFIIGLLYAPIVLTGTHHLFNAIFIQDTIQNGGNFLFIGTCGQAIAQGSAVLGYIICNKDDPRAKDVGVPAVISAYLGVTEPAMYGINLKHMYPFVGACVGSSVALEIAVISGTSSYNSGNGAWLGILNVQVKSKIPGVTTWIGTGYTWFMISMVAAAAISIFLTMALSKIDYFKKFNLDLKAAELLK